MKTKGRLITTIIVFLLILLLITFAVIGVVKGQKGIEGDISLMSQDVNATVTGKIWGHKGHATEDEAEILVGDTWDSETAEEGQNVINWKDLDLTFADKNTDIVIQISVKNDDVDVNSNPILVNVQNNTDTEGKNFTVTIENTGTATSNIITPGETIVYTITLKIVNKGLKVDGNLDVSFNFAKV